MRYAAPAYLTTEKATAEEASRAESPMAAAATCTSAPTSIPRTDATPARLPWCTLRVTM